jgi:uncharacterized protein YceH (UPF0502 family)
MPVTLDLIELRVLGSLLEKQMTTPEYYPMTRNGLTAACNQKTNREPVMDLREDEVGRALDRLRDKGLVHTVSGGGGRVTKYGQMLVARLQLSAPQKAALCALMLRGPQTVGEIRGRSDRMHSFADLREVEETLESLMQHAEGPLVVRLEREPGRKESRYAQTLAEMPEGTSVAAAGASEARHGESESAAAKGDSSEERIARLEEQVERLQGEVEELRQMLAEFRRQFE